MKFNRINRLMRLNSSLLNADEACSEKIYSSYLNREVAMQPQPNVASVHVTST